MVEQRGVIVTDNPLDYAVAISVHRQVAKDQGLRGCYPVQLPSRFSQVYQKLFTYYDLKVIDFASLLPAASATERSRLAADLYAANDRKVTIPTDSGTETLAAAIQACLQNELPLVLDAAAASDVPVPLPPMQTGRPNHVLCVRRKSEFAIAAMFYAQLMRKQAWLVDDVEEIFESGRWRGVESAILVDDFPRFNKAFLERIAGWLPTDGVTNSPAILTAYSPAAFSGLIWRMLEHQDFRKSGRRSQNLKPFELMDLGNTRPLEYAVVPEHGNESHMHYGHDVVCGAVSSDFRGESKRPFNCEWSCPHEPRYSAAQIPVHHLAIISCNTLTLGDGVVTPDFSLLLNFLNGWPIAVIAPFQHAVATPAAAILADALIQSGLNLGEITQRLNSVSPVGSHKFPAYVLVGDPEVVIGNHAAKRATTKITATPATTEITFSEVRGRIAEYALPEDLVTAMLSRGERPAVTSISGLMQPGVHFCFTTQRGSVSDGLLIFSEQDLPAGPWVISIEPIGKPTERDRALIANWSGKIHQQRVFGFDPVLISRLEDAVVSLVRVRSSYPGYSESLFPAEYGIGGGTLSGRLQLVRHALLKELVQRTADRVWLSHHYAEHYPSARHLDSGGAKDLCAFCGIPTHCWRYEDDCTGLAARDMVICPRCGIVNDCPAASEVQIDLQPVPSISGTTHRQRIRIGNHSGRDLRVSYFVQFHSWRKLGVDGDTQIFEDVIPPEGWVEREIDFHFARPLPDYIHDVMSYVLTDTLDLYCVGQRVATQQKGMFVARQGDAHAHHPHDPHQHGHHAAAHPPAHDAHAQHASPHPPQPHAPMHSQSGHDILLDPFGIEKKKPAKRPIVIIEPHAALYRYLQIARRRFHVIVLTTRPDRCLQRERYYNRSMGFPTGTQLDRLIQCDTTSVDAMYEALVPWKDTLAGALAGDDVFVPVTAELGRRFNFDYALPEDGVTQHLKTAMKQRFRERNIPTPRFVIARSLEEARQAWEELGRDCMVKMVDFEASMNIFRVSSAAELEAAWDAIVNNRNNLKMPFPLSREVILEEFVSGRELTIEGYVQGDRVVCLNFCEKITDQFIVVGHLLPALVSEKEAEILRHVAEHCVRAVGMRNTVFHVEVHLAGDTPYVIECAARPPGANMVELMYRSYGFDLMEISLSLAANEPVTELPREPKVHFAMLALYSKQGGKLDRIDGLEELRGRGGVAHIHLDAKPGDVIEPLSGTHQADGFVMLEDLTALGVRDKAAWMQEHVRLLLAEELEQVA